MVHKIGLLCPRDYISECVTKRSSCIKKSVKFFIIQIPTFHINIP